MPSSVILLWESSRSRNGERVWLFFDLMTSVPRFQEAGLAPFAILTLESLWSALFQVAFTAVAVGHRYADAHEPNGGQQQ